MKSPELYAQSLMKDIAFICEQHPEAHVYWSARIKSDAPRTATPTMFRGVGAAGAISAHEPETHEFYVTAVYEPGHSDEWYRLYYAGPFTADMGLIIVAMKLGEFFEDRMECIKAKQRKAA